MASPTPLRIDQNKRWCPAHSIGLHGLRHAPRTGFVNTNRKPYLIFKDFCVIAFCVSRFEQTCSPVRCDFSGRIGVVGLRYAIAGVCLFKMILFAALSRFWRPRSIALDVIQTAASLCQSTAQYGNGGLRSVC